MKKKYIILALTFLCLLIGQISYSQPSSGDYEDTNDVCDPRSIAFNDDLCDPEIDITNDPCDIRMESYDPCECDPSSCDPCDPFNSNYNPMSCTEGSGDDGGTGGGSGGTGGGSSGGGGSGSGSGGGSSSPMSVEEIVKNYLKNKAKTFFGANIDLWSFNGTNNLTFAGTIHTSEMHFYNYLNYGFQIMQSTGYIHDSSMLLMHEYGHYLHAQYNALNFYSYAAISSLWTANDPYLGTNNWTEIRANTMSYYYFGMPNGWNFTKYPIEPDYLNQELINSLINHN